MSFVFSVTLVVYNQAAVALAATAETVHVFIVPPLRAAVTMGLQASGTDSHASPRRLDPPAAEAASVVARLDACDDLLE
jgi:hypothetical protein